MSGSFQKDVRSVGVKIKIFGVGGAGSNAVNRLVSNGLKGIETTCINTDEQALQQINNSARLAIGKRSTAGFGAGGDPVIGRRAAEEDLRRLQRLVANTDLIFVTAGMGGGTGSGAAPILASLARRQGALTVGVVSVPFEFEGAMRKKICEEALSQMAKSVDSLLVVDNNKILKACEPTISVESAFSTSDELLGQSVTTISHTITTPGMINIDFADLRTVMGNSGRAYIAHGQGEGKNAAVEAAKQALKHPLLNTKVTSASSALINIVGGHNLSLSDIHHCVEPIRRAIKKDANIVVGVINDTDLKDSIQLTLIATGITPSKNISNTPRQDSPEKQPTEFGSSKLTQSDLLGLSGNILDIANHTNGCGEAVLTGH